MKVTKSLTKKTGPQTANCKPRQDHYNRPFDTIEQKAFKLRYYPQTPVFIYSYPTGFQITNAQGQVIFVLSNIYPDDDNKSKTFGFFLNFITF